MATRSKDEYGTGNQVTCVAWVMYIANVAGPPPPNSQAAAVAMLSLVVLTLHASG